MLFQNGQAPRQFLKIPFISIAIASLLGCQSLANSPSKVTGAEWELKPNSVHDGDTFRVIHSRSGEELKIRMACIDAPELKQPLGKQSRDYLKSLLNQNPDKIIVTSSGKDRYGRTIAEIFIPNPKNPNQELAVNGLMIKSGMAYFYGQYAKACKDNAEIYAGIEKQAQQERVGVWENKNNVKPWDYRKKR